MSLVYREYCTAATVDILTPYLLREIMVMTNTGINFIYL